MSQNIKTQNSKQLLKNDNTRDIAKLPKWVQKHIKNLEEQVKLSNKKLEQISIASDVLHERQWFTVSGPKFDDKKYSRTLWVLDKDMPVALCSLGKNDVLLVGRASANAREL